MTLVTCDPSGALAWRYPHPGRDPSNPKENCNFDGPISVSPDGSTVYAGSISGGVAVTVGSGAENIFAIDAATGSLKWKVAA